MSVRAALVLCAMAGAACACTLPELNIQYPPLARQARISGEVAVRLAYGEDGVPVVASASGHPLLREAATEAIRSASTPASCLGQPAEFVVKFTLLACYAERHWSRAERVNEVAWAVSAPTPYMIACGVEKVARKFPFFFLTRSVDFCRRLPSDAPVCSSSAEVGEALRAGAAAVR